MYVVPRRPRDLASPPNLKTQNVTLPKLAWPWMNVGRVRDTVPVHSCVVGKKWLLRFGVLRGMWFGSIFVHWLFGGIMVGFLVVLFVTLLSFLAMPGLSCFLRVKLPKHTNHGTPQITTRCYLRMLA